ncbi:MAG: FG-GAP-like repeat-containing protein, partial [Polyangiaceae bacterium]
MLSLTPIAHISRARCRRAFRVGLASLSAMSIALSGHAAPGPVFATRTPTASTPAAANPSTEAGDSVSSDGEAKFNYPLSLPPGRNGMQPSVSLQYSSRNPTRGGIAAGWTLPVDTISLDTSVGRAQGEQFSVNGRRLIPVVEPAKPSARSFRAEGDGEYVRYEYVNDGSEAGYWIARHTSGRVVYYGTLGNRDERVQGSVGDTRYGGKGRWFVTKEIDAAGNAIRYTYNKVYGTARNGTVTNTIVDIQLAMITYGLNVNVPGSIDYTNIGFDYAPELSTCPGSSVPIGAQFNYTTGIRRYEGAKKLNQVRVYTRESASVGYKTRHLYKLGYDTDAERCDSLHGPRRVLSSITETAYAPDGTATTKPAVEFEYGALQLDFNGGPSEPTDIGWLGVSAGHNVYSEDKPGGWPTLDVSRIDLDGDGQVDELISQGATNDYCDGGAAKLPIVPWADGNGPAPNDAPFYLRQFEGCSLQGQVTHRTTDRGNFSCGQSANFFGYRFSDIDGDGKPELLAALDYQKGSYRPTETGSGVNQNYGSCLMAAAPPCSKVKNGQRVAIPCLQDYYHQLVFPLDSAWNSFGSGGNDPTGGTTTGTNGGNLLGSGGTGSTSNAAPGDSGGTGGGGGGGGGGGSSGDGGTGGSGGCGGGECTGPEGDCDQAYCSQGSMYDPPIPALDGARLNGVVDTSELAPYGSSPSHPSTGYTDPHCGQVPDMHCGYYPIYVYDNVDGDFTVTPPRIINSPVPLESLGLNGGVSGGLANASSWRGFVDLDGDSYPDAIYQTPEYLPIGDEADSDAIGLRDWQVWYGNGVGGFKFGASSLTPTGNGRAWAVPNSFTSRQRVQWYAQGQLTTVTAENRHDITTQRTGLHDINGDGLPDMVTAAARPDGSSQLRVYYNTGNGFEDGSGTVLSDDIETLSEVIRIKAKANWAAEIEQGFSVQTVRDLDLDNDGLKDVVVSSRPAAHVTNPFGYTAQSPVVAYINTGDRYIRSSDPSLQPYRSAFVAATIYNKERWRTATDVADFNGDGLLDLVTPDADPLGLCSPPENASADYEQCALNAHLLQSSQGPLQVLKQIRTGTGATISFEYAPVNDPEIVTRGPGSRVSAPIWVVSQRSVNPGSGAVQTTDYRYSSPTSGFDRFGKHHFWGFERIERFGPVAETGQRAHDVEDYRYDLN